MSRYLLEKLSLDEKIGQLFVVGFDGLEINDHVLELVNDYKVGNFILFSRNIDHPKQLFDLNKSLHKLVKNHIGVVPFISVDQEGGMVTRIKTHLTYYPGAMTLCATGDSMNAFLIGRSMGDDLARMGFNLNLAPVLDVNINPNNPVIGVRSYSDQPELVSEFGLQFIKGLQKSVIATGKHFPGHGDTFIDSHLSLPTIHVSQERFKAVELKPFVDAIRGGIKAIMSSHVDFPGITENHLPSTLSKNVLTNLLRNELHFEGLILTDCMEMKAIQNQYSTKEASLMSILAGANQVGISHTLALQIAAMKRVKEAVLSGELPIEVLDERVSRVLKFKNQMKEFDYTLEYESVSEFVDNDSKKEFSRNVVASAVTLVKGNPVVLKDKPLLIAFEPASTSIADESGAKADIVSAVRSLKLGIDAIPLSVNPQEEEMNVICQLISSYKQIIICEYNCNQYPSQTKLIEKALEKVEDVHVFSMRNPYVLFQCNRVKNYVCFYEYTPNSLFALKEYLKGNLTPKGKVPVRYV